MTAFYGVGDATLRHNLTTENTKGRKGSEVTSHITISHHLRSPVRLSNHRANATRRAVQPSFLCCVIGGGFLSVALVLWISHPIPGRGWSPYIRFRERQTSIHVTSLHKSTTASAPPVLSTSQTSRPQRNTTRTRKLGSRLFPSYVQPPPRIAFARFWPVGCRYLTYSYSSRGLQCLTTPTQWARSSWKTRDFLAE